MQLYHLVWPIAHNYDSTFHFVVVSVVVVVIDVVVVVVINWQTIRRHI